MRINFLEKEDTDYCVEFLCFRPLLKLKGRSLKAWTLRTASSLCMHECLFYKAHASFSPPCEFTRFMHFFFLTTVRTYQTHVLFFSPPCELIKLMHSFFHRRANLSNSCTLLFHHRANLSGSCTLLLFFTTVRTYQTHALFFFHHRVNLSVSCTLFSTTVWTYQSHALFFRLLEFRPAFYTCKNIVVLQNRVEGTWRYCNDENYVVQKPCLVYSFG